MMGSVLGSLVAFTLGASLWASGLAAARGGSADAAGPRPTPSPAPRPGGVTTGGYLRSYYFTRQNASNNPGARFDFAGSAPYSAAGVNQASWNSAVSVGAQYAFPGGWSVGGAYLYGNPMDGPCVVVADHVKGSACVTQIPPAVNPDDTLPGFTLGTLYQAYLKYEAYGWSGEMGNVLFASPWANPADSRLKPVAFQGADLGYAAPGGLTVQGADMLTFENRTSSAFTHQTLLTGYPSGGGGLPANIDAPGGHGIDTNGFAMGKVGYAGAGGIFADGYFYDIADLADIWWVDARYTMRAGAFAPFVALQGGSEHNAGKSYLGKIDSGDAGAALGAGLGKNLVLSVGYDAIPWRSDTIVLPKNVTCSNSTHQISAKGATLGYFLPSNAAQCLTTGRSTQIYYGGWASPYTDGYTADPFFTTQMSQGMADRRAPGTSWKIALTFASTNRKWTFIASDAWYDYGNALAPENTKEWDLDGRYHFSAVGTQPYRGWLLRYRYAQRTLSNTFCGAAGTRCPAGSSPGAAELGGLPLFKYNRAQLEYDF